MKTVISEAQLKKIIKETIKNNLHFMGAMKKDRFPLYNSYLTDKQKINEAYFRTYDIDFVKRFICNCLNFTDDEKEFSKNSYNGLIQDDYDSLLVLVPSTYDMGNLESAMSLCGYIKAKTKDVYDDLFLMIDYEKRNPNEVNEMLENIDFLYHVTPMAYLPKIMETGLCPKSKNSEFSYGDESRVYLFSNTMKAKEISDMLYYHEENKEYKNRYALLRIDIASLKNRMKFYVDPNYDNSFYVRENISPEFIKIIKENIIP